MKQSTALQIKKLIYGCQFNFTSEPLRLQSDNRQSNGMRSHGYLKEFNNTDRSGRWLFFHLFIFD
jgi:hypothetical protein